MNQKTKTFTWEPDFNTLKRQGGFVSNILNSLRLEHFLIKRKVEKLNIEVCGKNLCSSGTIPLNIYNVNRGPTLNHIENIVINETQELIIKPTASDPDGDIIKFFFSEPTTRRGGNWKTSYEDEGKYTIQVTASDGKLEHTIPVNITVIKSNRQPIIKVETDEIIVNEGKEFTFVVNAKDPDTDNLTVKLENLPDGASFKNGVLKWSPLFNTVQNKSDNWKNNFVSNFAYLNKKLNSEKVTKWLSFSAFDGEIETIHPVKVIVKNVNQPPKIIDYLPIAKPVKVTVNEPLVFHILASDEDNDQLNYKWKFGLRQETVEGTNTIERTFVIPGEKKVKLIVSDGRKSIEKEWIIEVSEQGIIKKEIPTTIGTTNFKVYVVDQ